MANLNVKIAKVTGNPDANGWVQVHDFSPEDEDKLRLRGRLFAVIATRETNIEAVGQEIESVVTGREVLGRLHEEYFGNVTLTPFNAITQAVEKVIEEFQDSLGTRVEIAATAEVTDKESGKVTVFSAAAGGARVSIQRDGMIASLLASIDKQVISASGHPKEGDILFMGSSSFFSGFSDGDIKHALVKENLEVCIETLAPTLHTKEKSSSMGAVFIEFVPVVNDEVRVSSTEDMNEVVVNDTGQQAVLVESPVIKQKSGLRLKLAGVVGSIENKLPDRKVKIQKGLVDVADTKNKKLAVTVGIILLVLLTVSITFGIKQKRQKDTKESYESKLTQAEHEFDEALGLVSLNRDRARELFASSRGAVEEMVANGVEDERVVILKNEIDKSEGVILGEYKVIPELYVELSLLSDGFSGDEMAASLENIYVLDINGKKIVEVAVGTKKSKVVAGPEKVGGSANELAAYSERIFVMNSSGVKEIGGSEVIESEWGSGSMLYAYAGNIYVLDKGDSDVLRYPGLTTGFGSGKSWLAPGVELDLGSVKSWAIDGSVWLLYQDGDVTKLLNGASAGYLMSGVAPELTSADVIYTNEEIENVYILDKTNKRIVVTTKDGEFVAQYLSDQFGQVKDMAVSESEGKIILLTNGKLMAVGIGGDGGN